jgi:hypothetical protein
MLCKVLSKDFYVKNLNCLKYFSNNGDAISGSCCTQSSIAGFGSLNKDRLCLLTFFSLHI